MREESGSLAIPALLFAGWLGERDPSQIRLA